MQVIVKGVLSNLVRYDTWDYAAYPLQKDEAKVIVEVLKKYINTNENVQSVGNYIDSSKESIV